MLRSENVRDDEVVGEAGDGFLRVGKARGSSGGSETADRGSHGGMRDVGGHVEGVVCASLCVEASEKSVTPDTTEEERPEEETAASCHPPATGGCAGCTARAPLARVGR